MRPKWHSERLPWHAAFTAIQYFIPPGLTGRIVQSQTLTATGLYLQHAANLQPPCDLQIQLPLNFSRLMIYIYICHTAPLTSRCCILYIYSTNICTEYFKHAAHSPFFSSSKCRLFHNATFFGSCIIHILNTGCAKI